MKINPMDQRRYYHLYDNDKKGVRGSEQEHTCNLTFNAEEMHQLTGIVNGMEHVEQHYRKPLPDVFKTKNGFIIVRPYSTHVELSHAPLHKRTTSDTTTHDVPTPKPTSIGKIECDGYGGDKSTCDPPQTTSTPPVLTTLPTSTPMLPTLPTSTPPVLPKLPTTTPVLPKLPTITSIGCSGPEILKSAPPHNTSATTTNTECGSNCDGFGFTTAPPPTESTLPYHDEVHFKCAPPPTNRSIPHTATSTLAMNDSVSGYQSLLKSAPVNLDDSFTFTQNDVYTSEQDKRVVQCTNPSNNQSSENTRKSAPPTESTLPYHDEVHFKCAPRPTNRSIPHTATSTLAMNDSVSGYQSLLKSAPVNLDDSFTFTQNDVYTSEQDKRVVQCTNPSNNQSSENTRKSAEDFFNNSEIISLLECSSCGYPDYVRTTLPLIRIHRGLHRHTLMYKHKTSHCKVMSLTRQLNAGPQETQS